MRVKVHPSGTLPAPNAEACISITPDKKHGRTYYMGTLMLSDVEFRKGQTSTALVGEIVHEAVEQLPPSDKVLNKMVRVEYHHPTARYHTTKGKDVTDMSFRAAVIIGHTFYVSKD